MNKKVCMNLYHKPHPTTVPFKLLAKFEYIAKEIGELFQAHNRVNSYYYDIEIIEILDKIQLRGFWETNHVVVTH